MKDDILRARGDLDHFRRARRMLVEDYVGDLWVGGRPENTQPRIVVNLLASAIRAYTMALAANRPRAKVSTLYRELIPFSRVFAVTLNNQLERMEVEEPLRAAVQEACFFMGIVRVGRTPAGQTEYGDPGKIAVENISPDDWFHDTSARTDKKMRFAGHYYEADIRDLEADERIDPVALATLRPGKSRTDHAGAEANPVKLLEQSGERHEGYDNAICLADVWLPREGVIATYDADFTVLLAETKWDGPKCGPYHLLRFDRVPDSIIGIPITFHLKPLFALYNNIWRKLDRQARRAKSVGMFSAQNAGDALTLKRAGDGEFVQVNDPDAVKAITLGGVDGQLATFGIATADAFNQQSGNTEHMAGLGPSSDTVGQEKIIQGNVGQQLGKMAEAVDGWIGKVLEAVGFFMWTDEVLTLPGELPVYDRQSKTTEPVPFEWVPGDRDGEYAQYNFAVVPYSMAYKSPSEQAMLLERMLTGVIAPLMPFMQEQGIQVDFNAAFEALARLTDLDELREILVPAEPASNQTPGPMADGPRKPPVTQRNYTRTNVPTGGTRQGRNAAMASAFSGTSTPQQRATVSSPK